MKAAWGNEEAHGSRPVGFVHEYRTADRDQAGSMETVIPLLANCST
jgi:hypothetical protein